MRLVHVERGPTGITQVEPIEQLLLGGLDHAADKLGLRRSEALQMTRLFIVVEGEHDRVVLEELFGDELGQLRAAILRMGGTNNARSVLDSQMLFKYTDARVLVLLDGGYDFKRFDEAWTEAKTLVESGKGNLAMRVLRKVVGARPQEMERVFSDLTGAAVGSGKWRFLNLHWLNEPDMVYYLPADALDSRLDHWDKIQPEYLQSRKDLGIKDWLLEHHGIKITKDKMRKAAKASDKIHPDLTDLLGHMRRLCIIDSNTG